MTRTEHLLVTLCEECNEVAQRASKALRFGPGEIQPGQPLTNAQRLAEEMADLVGVYHMLVKDGALAPVGVMLGQNTPFYDAVLRKVVKVEKFLNLSKDLGTLTDG